MSKAQILATIRSLAKSQGFYCRVLEEIQNDPAILDKLEAKNFKDELDMILFFEC